MADVENSLKDMVEGATYPDKEERKIRKLERRISRLDKVVKSSEIFASLFGAAMMVGDKEGGKSLMKSAMDKYKELVIVLSDNLRADREEKENG